MIARVLRIIADKLDGRVSDAKPRKEMSIDEQIDMMELKLKSKRNDLEALNELSRTTSYSRAEGIAKCKNEILNLEYEFSKLFAKKRELEEGKEIGHD